MSETLLATVDNPSDSNNQFELLNGTPKSLEQLRLMRSDVVSQLINDEFDSTFDKPIGTPIDMPPSLLSARQGTEFYEGVVSPHTAFWLRELGSDIGSLMNTDAGESTVEILGNTYSLAREGRNGILSKKITDNEFNTGQTSSFIVETIRKSKPQQVIDQLKSRKDDLKDGFSEEVEIRDPLEIAVIAAKLNPKVADNDFALKVITGQEVSFVQRYQDLAEAHPRYYKVKQDGNKFTIDINSIHNGSTDGHNISVILDFIQEGGAEVLVGVGMKADETAYLEFANEEKSVQKTPFIETEEAAKLFTEFDRTGITISRELENILIKPGEADRYGSPYTHMSREVAKWVNEGSISEARLSKLFGIEENGYDITIAKLLQLNVGDLGEAGAKLVDIIQQVIKRGSGDTKEPNIPVLNVTTERIDMKDGSCFDVAGYFDTQDRNITQATYAAENGETFQGFYERTGMARIITAEPISLNGIDLPSGTQIRRMPDGTFAMLRLTPWALKTPESRDQVFGAELAKAKKDRERFKRLSDFAVQRIGTIKPFDV